MSITDDMGNVASELMAAKVVVATALGSGNITLALPALAQCQKALTDALAVVGKIVGDKDVKAVYEAITTKHYFAAVGPLLTLSKEFGPAALIIYNYVKPVVAAVTK